MTVCFFGNYKKDYPRIVVLQKGLQQNGVDVMECQTRKTGLAKFLELYRQHRKLKGGYDYMIVGMAGYTLVWFAKLLSEKPVIFDAFVSLYLTNVEDRKNCKPGSLKARYYAFLDKFSCKAADRVLLDTNAQIDYFVQKYNLDKKKFIRVPVGTDPDTFFPNSKFSIQDSKFIVHWHGYIVPFHGLETIIEAANILKDNPEIEFRIITKFNDKYEVFKKRVDELDLHNLFFYPETEPRHIAGAINEADTALGVFGNNLKARVVIPNKIYEAAACKKPVITVDTPALRELFNEESIVFCRPGDGKHLADLILDLYTNRNKKDIIAEKAYKIFCQRADPSLIGRKLLEDLAV